MQYAYSSAGRLSSGISTRGSGAADDNAFGSSISPGESSAATVVSKAITISRPIVAQMVSRVPRFTLAHLLAL
nr:MAG TPA: hypothetical protein [Caudoviricetes sp.]